MIFFAKSSSLFLAVLFVWCTHVGLGIDLVHRDSRYYDHSLTPFQRVQNVIHRSILFTYSQTSSSFNSTITHNPSLKDYMMQLYLGTPPAPVWFIMDTSGFITWTQCGPCIGCPGLYTPYFDNQASSTFAFIPCATSQCSSIYESGCDSRFNYYCGTSDITVDGISYPAYIVFDTISFSPTISFPSSYFVCIFPFFAQANAYGNADGIASLGNTSNSLISEINVTTFSYCLQNLNSQANSTIYFGDSGKIRFPLVSTPLETKFPPGQKNSYYYITLLSFTVGIDVINFPGATLSTRSNIIIEPTTFLTYLPSDMVNEIVDALQHSILCPRASGVEAQMGLNLCYNVSNSNSFFHVPPIRANFFGGSLNLPQVDTFVEVQPGVQCLTIVNTIGNVIWGSGLQANFNIEYDLTGHLLKLQPNNNCRTST